MTTSTRRYVWASAMLLMLLAPVAFLTWPTVAGTEADATRGWVASLSAEDLDVASRSIDEYPIAYRRAIMRGLSPDKRSAVWRGHIQKFLDSHQDINVEARTALKDTAAFFTPTFFATQPSAETLERLEAAASRVRQELGKARAKSLLVNLGPEDEESHLAWNKPSVLNYLRNKLVVNAQAPYCSCSMQSDWCGDTAVCAPIPPPLGCIPVDPWPACGTGWNYRCDGACFPIGS